MRSFGFSLPAPVALAPFARYDPSAPGALFQTAAGTGPVTAEGQPVGWLTDGSGSGNHLLQAAAGRRPVYRNGGGLHWLAFDGADDFLRRDGVALPATHSATLAAEITVPPSAFDSLYSVDAAKDYQIDAGGAAGFQFRLLSTGIGVAATPMLAAPVSGPAVFTVSLDAAAGTVTGRLNGAQVWQAAGYDGQASPVQVLSLFANRAGNDFLGGRLFAAVFWAGAAAEEIAVAEAWAAARAGLSLQAV